VKNPFTANDLPEALRRRLDLAVAVAQERLLTTHVDHALRLIQLVGDQVPFENALDIYTRMLRLSDDEARVITTRALAILGEQAAESSEWPDLVAEERESPDTERRSFMKGMRERLRGRVKEDLRRYVELSAATTEVAILETHVQNALNFVELLKDEQPLGEAVEMYLEALEVRDSVGEVTYYITLSRLADEFLPNRDSRPRTPDVTGQREGRSAAAVDTD